eukprot:TRINITY_DN6271_c0_g1_i5.p1 TRINITY_DN6271_c0_g1~~TRINITY_DN6271_c0_g1_i5.p1  ORF type:complete len:103 (-),score=43.56 TRINITY_DN6271_c0_g1_i5:72-380(-)
MCIRDRSSRMGEEELHLAQFGPELAEHARELELMRYSLGFDRLQLAISDGWRNRVLRRAMRTLSLIHISEPTRLLSISYAVFCLKKKKKKKNNNKLNNLVKI